MVCIVRRVMRTVVAGLVVCAAAAATVGIVSPVSVSALSKEEASAISSNCSTIKQSLSQLQKADSKTRTYLGTTYETIASRFITPLNLRLVRNNRPTLSSIQSEFSDAQIAFRDDYTNYMREMENLISIDCRVEPEKFYDQLKVVRERREKVRLATEELKKLTAEQYQAVVKLRKEIKK